MKLEIKYVDGRVEDITAVASARLEYEQKHGEPIAEGFILGRSEAVFFLAFRTLQRTGKLDGDVEMMDWLDGVAEVNQDVSASTLTRFMQILGVKVAGLPTEDASDEEAVVSPPDGAGNVAGPSRNGSRKRPSKVATTSDV